MHWRLLSSAPIDGIEAAHRSIADYRRRWLIEQLFRTLKSQGLGIEDSQIETPRVLRKLALVALRAAVVCTQLGQRAKGSIGALPPLPSTRTTYPSSKPSLQPSTEKPSVSGIPSSPNSYPGPLGSSRGSPHGAAPTMPNHPDRSQCIEACNLSIPSRADLGSKMCPPRRSQAPPARFQPRPMSPSPSQPSCVTTTVSSSLTKPRLG